MAAMQVQDDGTWRTPAFRQNMVSKIEEAILQCGAPTSKNAAEMENQVFSRANSKTEYLSFVARLIIHIKEMGTKSRQQAAGGQQNQPQGPMGPMGGGQPNMMMGQGQMNPMNQMGVNVMTSQNMQPGQQGMPQQMVNQGMQQQQQQQQQPPPGSMNMPQQQPGQQNPLQPGMQMNQQGPLQQQQQQNQMMNPNFMNQAQMQQQQQQMQNSGMNQGQMQNPGGVMGNPQMQQMQNSPMGNPQMQQMQNVQMQMQMQQQQQQQQQNNQPNPGQNQMMQVRGMQNSQQVGQRMMGQNQNIAANQLSHLANQQRKIGQQNRPMGHAMGIPRPEHGPNYGINRLNYYGANNLAQQVDNVGMVNQYPGVPGGPPIQRPGGQFIPPNASSVQMSIGAGPPSSSNTMSVAGSNVQGQPGFANSPQPGNIMHGSPAPPGNVRPYSSLMAPSPTANLSTPMSQMVPTPSPRTAEDQACMEKIKELKKYTDLLQRMIAKIGNEDMEKSSKMKKLLEILTNPNQRVSMDLLLKCETALKKMEKQQHDAGGVMNPASQPMPTKDQISPFQQIQDAILTALKNGSSSHTFLRTFRPTIESLTGQSAFSQETHEDTDVPNEIEQSCSLPWVLQKELKLLDHRFYVKVIRNTDRPMPLRITALLGDKRLPRVPPLKIHIPNEYPDESPTVIDLKKEYRSTPLLSAVGQAMKSRLMYLPEKFTVLELLNCWEMSVRQASNPNPHRKLKTLKRVGVKPPFAISFFN